MTDATRKAKKISFYHLNEHLNRKREVIDFGELVRPYSRWSHEQGTASLHRVVIAPKVGERKLLWLKL